MSYHIAPVKNYHVACYRATRFASIGYNLNHARSLVINLETTRYSDGLRQVVIYFQDMTNDRFDRGLIRESGLGQRTGTSATIRLPLHEYAYYYHLLQTEKPLFFMWNIEGGAGAIQTIQLTSFEEPIGEGESDSNAA